MSITTITGPMFADKTTTLIRLIRGTNGEVTVIRPSTDTRYSRERIVSHSGDYFDAAGCDPDKILDLAQTLVGNVFIDEGHFFPCLVEAVLLMVARGCTVTIAGIDIDYRKQPFVNMQRLMALAKNHIICRAVCKCGKFASYTKMRDEFRKSCEIVVGGSEKYAPYCGSVECEEW